MYKIKKINLLSLAYTLTIIYFIVGAFLSISVVILKSNPAWANAINPNILLLNYSQIFLIYPVAYAFGGFISGLLISVLYNFTAKYTGGISINLSKE